MGLGPSYSGLPTSSTLSSFLGLGPLCHGAPPLVSINPFLTFGPQSIQSTRQSQSHTHVQSWQGSRCPIHPSTPSPTLTAPRDGRPRRQSCGRLRRGWAGRGGAGGGIAARHGAAIVGAHWATRAVPLRQSRAVGTCRTAGVNPVHDVHVVLQCPAPVALGPAKGAHTAASSASGRSRTWLKSSGLSLSRKFASFP